MSRKLTANLHLEATPRRSPIRLGRVARSAALVYSKR
jgi:hypothetical protein